MIRCLAALSRVIQRTVPSFRGPYLELSHANPSGMAIEGATAVQGLNSTTR